MIQLLDFVRSQFKKTDTKRGDVQVRMRHLILNFPCCTGNIELKYATYKNHVVIHEYFSIEVSL